MAEEIARLVKIDDEKEMCGVLVESITGGGGKVVGQNTDGSTESVQTFGIEAVTLDEKVHLLMLNERQAGKLVGSIMDWLIDTHPDDCENCARLDKE